jgi:uncharacterized membrane protein YeaQ/YmgE (transglycosylase-associated protein family)
MVSFVTVIYFVIIGGLAGWLASMLVTGRGFGIIADILIGIVGAVIGGLIFGGTGTTLMTFVVAFIGAVILLAVVKAIKRI